MTTTSNRTFTVPTREEVTENNQGIFDNLKKGLGFVPNLYAYFAKSETALGDYMALQNRKSSLKGKEREVINLVVSQINGCRYCQSAHTVLGKMNGFTDDQVIGASYSRIDNATRTHTTAILEKKFGKAIHAIAPASHNAASTPVLVTTGDLVGGRRRLTYDDLVAFKDACDKAGMSKLGRRFVPCNDHYNDMLLDRKSFGDQIVNYKAGTLAPNIAGFDIYPDFANNPYYTVSTKARVAFGAVPGAETGSDSGDKFGAVIGATTGADSAAVPGAATGSDTGAETGAVCGVTTGAVLVFQLVL